jgi:hypothetical protein
MRTNSRRRGAVLSLAVLALVVSLPELALAQQSGLFPNAPIRRQRVPCDQQDPVYRKAKELYFGYHATCWRRFPDGWGCPSPERPDWAKSLREQKLDTGEEPSEPNAPGPEGPMRPEGTGPAMPVLPERGPSPFDMPDRPGTPPAAPRGGTAPLPLPPGDPFQLDEPAKPPGAAPTAPRAGQTRPSTPPAVNNGPELSAPAEEGARIPGSRTSRNDADEATDGQTDTGPLLALPNVNLPPVYDPASFGTEPAQTTVDNNAATNSTSSPGSSAPRRGFLSGLFDNLGLNWTRR